MARARPAQRPIVRATCGSLSGPSTTSVRPKISRISEKPISNIANACSGAPVVLAWRRAAAARIVEFGVLGCIGGQLLLRSLLFLVALIHGLLEATDCGAQVRADGAQ